MDSVQKNATEAAQALDTYFSKLGSCMIAYSGGIDSALLAYAANKNLECDTLAVMADGPSLSRREYKHAIGFAEQNNIPLKIIKAVEMDDPAFRTNSEDRCYHCKKHLFTKIEDLDKQLNKTNSSICYGGNTDDLGDYRPGMDAARERGINAPYIELGINKKMIRNICTHYGLSIADKPASPCLASRMAYGQEVNSEHLNQVEQAEDILHDMGFRIFRVRHHGDVARIEVQEHDFEKLLKKSKKLSPLIKKLGFKYVSMDLDGFRSGSLNEAIGKVSLATGEKI